MHKNKQRIGELANVVRSKNAGSFMTTCDIFFEQKQTYDVIKKLNPITKEIVAKLYGISVNSVVGIYYHDNALGIKVTFIKPSGTSTGDIYCTDIYGAQQFIPLLDIEA